MDEIFKANVQLRQEVDQRCARAQNDPALKLRYYQQLSAIGAMFILAVNVSDSSEINKGLDERIRMLAEDFGPSPYETPLQIVIAMTMIEIQIEDWRRIIAIAQGDQSSDSGHDQEPSGP